MSKIIKEKLVHEHDIIKEVSKQLRFKEDILYLYQGFVVERCHKIHYVIEDFEGQIINATSHNSKISTTEYCENPYYCKNDGFTVYQINYRFYLGVCLDSRYTYGREESTELFMNLIGKKPPPSWLNSCVDLEDIQKPVEIHSNIHGFLESFSIQNFKNFDYQQYKSNLDSFLKKYSEDEYWLVRKTATELFNKNLEFLAKYFITSVDFLKSKNFNKVEGVVRRLNKKIINKHTYETS